MEGYFTDLPLKKSKLLQEIKQLEALEILPKILNNVPYEIWLMIFKNLKNGSLLRVCWICSFWRTIVLENKLFEKTVPILEALKLLNIPKDSEIPTFIYGIVKVEHILPNLMDFTNEIFLDYFMKYMKSQFPFDSSKSLYKFRKNQEKRFVYEGSRNKNIILCRQYMYGVEELYTLENDFTKNINGFDITNIFNLKDLHVSFRIKKTLFLIKLT